MAKLSEAISAMVSPDVRAYIDDEAEKADVGPGVIIRRLLDKGITAEKVTEGLRGVGVLEEEDDVLDAAARNLRAVVRRATRGQVDTPTMAGEGRVRRDAAGGLDASGVDTAFEEIRDDITNFEFTEPPGHEGRARVLLPDLVGIPVPKRTGMLYGTMSDEPEYVVPSGLRDRIADLARHDAGETPRPPGADDDAEWDPDPKVRARRAREKRAKRTGLG